MKETYDLILVGSGFASSFFLLEALRHLRSDQRVLVLERGPRQDHATLMATRNRRDLTRHNTFINRTPEKSWAFTTVFGGSSNCWWGCVPRFLPSDFRMRSLFGIGEDWPLTYDELEPYYAEVEEVMSVSGPDDGSPFPRSTPYPQPPHALSTPDRLLKKAFPSAFFIQPTARLRRAIPGRAACCGTGVCSLCPIDAKFTILNSMARLYDDPRVSLRLDATVRSVGISGGVATDVHWYSEGKEHVARGDLIVLGANGIFNPHILLNSGLSHPLLGRGLHEQLSVDVAVDLDGVDGFDGSTSITGHGYMLYDGPHRAHRAAALLETTNLPFFRPEPGKWRQQIRMKVIFEELPGDGMVEVAPKAPDRPSVTAQPPSDYVRRARAELPSQLEHVLASLPVEAIRIEEEFNETESHLLGSVRMGRDSEHSVIDGDLVHHTIRNLVVAGSSSFPTSSPSNPTLTLSALSVRSARRLFASSPTAGTR